MTPSAQLEARVTYRWAAIAAGPRCATIGDLARLLGLCRSGARARLLASPVVVACRLVRRSWLDSATGRRYGRRAWAIPPKALRYLIVHDLDRATAFAQPYGSPVALARHRRVLARYQRYLACVVSRRQARLRPTIASGLPPE